MPTALRDTSHVTGIELDPVTARIARLLQPKARVINADFARTDLDAIYDLAIGNPPFSDRTVRSDRQYRPLGLRLHDYFIARSIVGGFARRAEEIIDGELDASPTIRAVVEALMRAPANILEQIRHLEAKVRSLARQNNVVRRLMSVPGVGVNREHHIWSTEPIQRHDEAVKVPTSKRTMSLTCDASCDQLDNRD